MRPVPRPIFSDSRGLVFKATFGDGKPDGLTRLFEFKLVRLEQGRKCLPTISRASMPAIRSAPSFQMITRPAGSSMEIAYSFRPLIRLPHLQIALRPGHFRPLGLHHLRQPVEHREGIAVRRAQ